MNNQVKQLRKLIIIVVIAGVLLYGGYLGVIAFLHSTHGILKISSIPDDATVLLDGKRVTANGTVLTKAGSHTLTSSRAGFQDTTNKFTIKNGQTISIQLYPKSTSDVGEKWLLAHPDKAILREGVGGQEHAATVNNAIQQNSFITQLPYIGAGYEYRIDYGDSNPNNKYPDQPTIIITGATQQAQDDAITWMRNNNYNPDTMNIKFVTATPQ